MRMTVRRDHEGLVIRPLAPDDEDAVVALWEAAGLTRPWNDPRKDITTDDVISLGRRLEHDTPH